MKQAEMLRTSARNAGSDRGDIWYCDPRGLKAYARNSRTHSDEQVSKIAASIRRFGFTVPLLVTDERRVIAGHGRLLAALLLGLAEVPVIVVTGWSAEDIRAYVIADNQLALEAGWDEDLLRLELGELRDAGFDLALTGFGSSALAALLDVRPLGLVDPEAAPALPETPVSMAGDLWALGRHRLLCGSATNAGDVAKVLGGAKPHLMVTDPPYGVDYNADWRRTKRKSDGSLLSTGSDRAVGAVSNDDVADWREAWALFPGDVAYVWHADRGSRQVFESLEATSFAIRAQIIWGKDALVVGRGDYHFQHEACWYAVRKNRTGHWNGGRKQSTLWDDIKKPSKSETGHSTQKPVECMRRPIQNNSKPGDAVYDPFCGSGTTIIAAEMNGRRCHAIELDPSYVDVSIQRWQSFTGLKAALVESGSTYDDVARERGAQVMAE
jgi:DNA modification methylase